MGLQQAVQLPFEYSCNPGPRPALMGSEMVHRVKMEIRPMDLRLRMIGCSGRLGIAPSRSQFGTSTLPDWGTNERLQLVLVVLKY